MIGGLNERSDCFDAFWDERVTHRLCVVASGGKFLCGLPSRKHRVGRWSEDLDHALKFSLGVFKDRSGVYSVDGKLCHALDSIHRYSVPQTRPTLRLLEPYALSEEVSSEDPWKLGVRK